jgi:hypothetical protein
MSEEPAAFIFKVEVESLEMMVSIYHKMLSWKVTVLTKVAIVVTIKTREYCVFHRKCI